MINRKKRPPSQLTGENASLDHIKQKIAELTAFNQKAEALSTLHRKNSGVTSAQLEKQCR